MGKLVLFLVAALAFGGAYYALDEQQAQHATTRALAADEFELIARNAALFGLDRAEQRLADDAKKTQKFSGTYDGADYDVKIQKKGKNGYIVVATGTVDARRGDDVEYHVRAEYRREPWSDIADEAPLFMQYLLMSGGNLYIGGNPNGRAYVPPDGSSAPPNADMHTNGLLDINGNSADVEGFGTYSLGVSPNIGRALSTFDPNSNPSGSPDAYQAPPVILPPFNVDVMADALVTDSVSNGAVTISGPGDLPAEIGTRDDPYVWHVKGKLTFSGNVTIPGYTIFLVNGLLDIAGSVKTPQTSFEGEDESTLAFYVGAMSKLSGSGEVWAQIYSNNAQIESSGSPKLYGNIVTNGSVDFSGSPDFYYRRPSPALTTFFQGGANDRLVRVAYSEW